MIGEKIKELRKKNNMTQESLANYLSVSFQTISKRECGVTSPDITMIVPIARLFKITTDELLEADCENYKRKEYDEAYNNYHLKDLNEMYNIALDAVKEFPNDYKYIYWLASMEYYMAFLDEDYQNGGSLKEYEKMLEKSLNHHKLVYENCNDYELRNSALFGIVIDLKYLNRLDEAKEYALKFEDEFTYNKAEMLAMVLKDEELLTIKQKIFYSSLVKLIRALQIFFVEKIEYKESSIKMIKNILNVVFENDNYYNFSLDVSDAYFEEAIIAINNKEYDKSLKCLNKAKEYAIKNDQVLGNKNILFNISLLDKYKVIVPEELSSDDSLQYFKSQLLRNVFNDIKETDEFKELSKWNITTFYKNYNLRDKDLPHSSVIINDNGIVKRVEIDSLELGINDKRIIWFN